MDSCRRPADRLDFERQSPKCGAVLATTTYGKRNRIVWRGGRWAVDSFTQQRVLELRKEIATLQHENELYRQKKYHGPAEFNNNELRRLRLLAIQEELLRLSGPSKRSTRAATPDNKPARMQGKFWDEWGREQ